jgi:Cdc6-like AAA superfamily ATPase
MKNPFPAIATINLESRGGERSTHLPFHPLPPVQSALAAVKARAERIDGDLEGCIIAIRGPHGTGKTRLMAELIAALSPAKGARPVLSLYGKCDVDGPAELLSGLLAQVSLVDYRQTVQGSLLDLVSQMMPSNGAGSVMAGDLESLYGSYAVGRDAVDARLRDNAPAMSRNDEFRTALSFFAREPALTELIHKWLTGGAVGSKALGGIGVTGPLSSPDDLLSALCLVISLRTQAHLPIAVFIDQIEHMARDATGLHVIRTLVEWIPIRGGLLVIAGNDAVYDDLAEDLLQRLSTVVRLRCLTAEEAEHLIRLYVEANAKVKFDELFKPGVVGAITETTAGNPRRLLQLCHRCFEIARDGDGTISTIDRPCVEQAALPAGMSIRMVVDHLRSVIAKTDGRVRRVSETAGGSDIVAVHDCKIEDRHGADIAWVFIRSAEFYLDEVQALREAIGSARRIAIGSPLLFIALGYVSTEVKKLMTTEGILYIEYDPSTFEHAVIAATAKTREAYFVRTIAGAGEVDGRLRRIEEALSSLTERRAYELSGLDRDVRAMGAEITGWSEDKATIRSDIADARRSRAIILAEGFWREYQSSRNLTARALALSGIVGAGAAVKVSGALDGYSLPYQYLMASSVAALAGAVGWFVPLRWSLKPVGTTLEDIEFTARRYLRVKVADRRSRNPFSRLAAALITRDEVASEDIVSLIRSEENPVVRRELLRSLSKLPQQILVSCFEDLCDDLDAPYLAEAIVRAFPTVLPDEIVIRASGRMQTVFAIYGHARWRSSDLAYCLAARMIDEPDGQLICDAYVDGSGDGWAVRRAAARISMSRIEAAEALLSPLEPDGLGALDALHRSRQIDDYYVFFRQLRFIREQSRTVSAAVDGVNEPLATSVQ